MAPGVCDPRPPGCDRFPFFTDLGHYHVEVPSALADQPRPWYVGLSLVHPGYVYLVEPYARPGLVGLFVVLAGVLGVRVDGRDTTIAAGQVLIIDHDFPAGDVVHRGGDCRCLTVFLAGAMAKGLLRDMTARFGCSHTLGVDHPALTRLLAPCLRPPPDRRVVLEPAAALDQVMAVIGALLAQADQAAHQDRQSSPAQALATAIRAKPSQPLNVTAAAARLGVSREHLTRAFCRLYGLPPATWRRRVLVEEAQRLREFDRMPAKAIAQRLGFANAESLRRLLARPGC